VGSSKEGGQAEFSVSFSALAALFVSRGLVITHESKIAAKILAMAIGLSM